MVTSRVLRLAPDPDDLLEGVRARARKLGGEGHTVVEPNACMYRFSTSREFTKITSRGVILGMVLDGEKDVAVEGHTLHVDPSRFVVVTRDCEFASHAIATPARPYHALSLWFEPDRVARVLLSLAESGLSTTTGATPRHEASAPAFLFAPDMALVSALERYLDALGDPFDKQTIAPLILDEILFRLLRTDAAAAVRAGIGPPQDAARILEVMQYIRANHAKKLSVPSLAKQVAMSPSHFAHRFSSVARTSPMKYVRGIRLERAKALLCETDARPSEVATRVGFESAAHFAREFKRAYGVPPSQYRERVV